jgi:hypothetical protein
MAAPALRLLGALGAALAAALLWLPGAADARSHARPCAGAGLRPGAASPGAIDAATLCLIDRIRAASRLAPLRPNRELASVASGQVLEMIRLDYFADVRPGGQTPLALVDATGYPASAATVAIGQNIAWGTGRYMTPAGIVAAWMSSPPHRAIILDSTYRDAGVAATPALPWVVGQGRVGATYAMEFGLRQR